MIALLPSTPIQPALPLLDGKAWWGALCVMGLASLLGAVLPPWRGRVGWLTRTAAGLPIVALAALAAGQVDGLLFHPLIWSIGGVAGLVLAVARVYHHIRTARQHEYDIFEAAGWLGVIAWLAVMLGPALSPPVSYDVLEYHQGIIPHVFEQGRFEPIPNVVYTRQPIATEALYTLAAVVETTAWGRAPGLLHWMMIVLGAAIFLRLLGILGIPKPWRPWLALVLLTQPIISRLQLDRMTDWTGVLLLGAGLLALRPKGLGAAALAGLIAGGAVTAKWTHAGTVALPLAVMCVALSPGRTRPARLAVFAGSALLIWLPWGAWLWHVARNPFSPFLAEIFPTMWWPAARMHFLMDTHGALSIIQAEYWTNLVARLGWGLAGMPWIAIALIVAAGAAGARWTRRGAPVNYACWLALGIFGSVLLWGGLRHAADRFLAPAIFGALVIVAVMLERALRRAPPPAGPALLALVVLFTAATTPQIPAAFRLAGPIVLGRITPAEYMKLSLGATADLFDAANGLPANARIIAIGEARRYPFRRPVALASVFDRSPADQIVRVDQILRTPKTAEDIRRDLVAFGYTHILVNEFEQARILAMHTPPELMGNAELAAMIQANDQAGMVERFAGATEFATEPPSDAELRAWRDFLGRMRERAIWKAGTRPAMYLAKLGDQ